MILAMGFLLALVSHHLPWARRPQEARRDPWEVFRQGRGREARRDPLGAFRCYLLAGQAGLPVAAAFTWMSYRLGGGVPADPIAAAAWAERATALGWPEGILETGGQEPGGPS